MRNSIKKFFGNISPFNNKTDMSKPRFIVKKLLAYLLCNMGGMIAGTAVVVLIHFPLGLNPLRGEAFEGRPALLFTMLNYLLPTVCVLLYWRFVEKKTLSEMYLKHGARGYLAGCLTGAGLLAACVGFILLTGSIRINGLTADPDLLTIALNGGVFVFQSAREEILCRGLAFCFLKDKLGNRAAFVFGTAAFMIPHLSALEGAGTAVTAVCILNMVLISAVFTLIMLVTDSLWAACGAHFLWNFFLNNIFGLTLSGTETDMNSIIRAESVGSSVLNGGSFGIEASIVTAAVYAVCAGLLYVICRKKTAVRTTANEGGLVYGL